jgi:hypothetical protein
LIKSGVNRNGTIFTMGPGRMKPSDWGPVLQYGNGPFQAKILGVDNLLFLCNTILSMLFPVYLKSQRWKRSSWAARSSPVGNVFIDDADSRRSIPSKVTLFNHLVYNGFGGHAVWFTLHC